MSIIAVAAVGIVAVLLAVQMKGVKGEYGTYISIAAGMFIFFYGLQKLESVLRVIEEIQTAIKMNNIYFSTMIKMVGVTYIGEFASAICKDSGCSFLGKHLITFPIAQSFASSFSSTNLSSQKHLQCIQKCQYHRRT